MKKLIFLSLLFLNMLSFGADYTSITDGDFSSPSTWDLNDVPSNSDNVIISHNVNLDVPTTTIESITIEANGILNFNYNTLRLRKDLVNSGTIICDNGFIIFRTNNSHAIYSSDTLIINNLKVRGGRPLRLYDPLVILDEIDINSSDLYTNDNLILESTENKTARISKINNDGFVHGDVRVKRYSRLSVRVWRYISSPVSDATVSDWQEEILITGVFDNPSTGSGVNSGSPSLYYYVEAYFGESDIGWRNYPSSGNSNDAYLEVGKGYSIYMRDNSDRPDYFDVKGEVNQGRIEVLLDYTQSPDGDDYDEFGNPTDGWNLVGNPYPSQIDWEEINSNRKDNIEDAFYTVDNTSGEYSIRYYANGIGVPSGTTSKIASSQAIWVRATGDGAKLTFKESDKTSETANFYKIGSNEDLLRVYVSDGMFHDELAINVNDAFTEEYEEGFDFYKIGSNNLNIASLTKDGYRVVINNVNTKTDSVELDIKNVKNKEYTFTFSGNPNSCLYDSKENILIPTTNSYTVSLSEDEDLSGRFHIIFNSVILNSGSSSGDEYFYVYPIPLKRVVWISTNIKGDVTITDLKGIEYITKHVDVIDYIDVSNLPKGIYVVTMKSGETVVTKKVVK